MFSIFPTIASRRFTQDSFSGSSPCQELSIFLTMGFVISSFALPIVLARTGTVSAIEFAAEILVKILTTCEIFAFTDYEWCGLFDTWRKCGCLCDDLRFLPDRRHRKFLRWRNLGAHCVYSELIYTTRCGGVQIFLFFYDKINLS